jgi:hypothetical protein
MHVLLVPALETAMVFHTQTMGHRLETRNFDSRIGEYAAVISGEIKGWQGHLIWLTDTTATIECADGQQNPRITGPLKDFVLLWVLCHLTLNVLLKICSKNLYFDLAGGWLGTSFVGRSLMRPLTPPPHPPTPPSLFPAAEAFEDVPTEIAASEAFKDTLQDHDKARFL